MGVQSDYLILIMNIISIKMLVYMDYITLYRYKEFMESHIRCLYMYVETEHHSIVICWERMSITSCIQENFELKTCMHTMSLLTQEMIGKRTRLP